MQIPENVGSKYRFIVLAGQRVSQLQKGAKPRMEIKKKTKLTRIALQELAEERLDFTRTNAEGEEILNTSKMRAEAEAAGEAEA